MRTSAEQIAAQAAALDFDPTAMEKVARLLELLDAIAGSPLLRRHLVLKGGTALNLFLLDLPRLSVDIDLNLIGATTREDLDAVRPRVDAGLEAVFESQGLGLRRRPEAHAGGKWSLRYRSVFGQGGQLEVDVNTLYRVPLWDPTPVAARLPQFSQRPTVLQERHEIVAGKLAALMDRSAGRDLFDVHELLTTLDLDAPRLRLAFVVSGAQSSHDWSRRGPGDVDADPRELRARLLPLLRRRHVPDVKAVDAWIERLLVETRDALGVVLPFREDERAFLESVHKRGEIRPELITPDAALQQRIAVHPGLLWKVFNVRAHRKRGGG